MVRRDENEIKILNRCPVPRDGFPSNKLRVITGWFDDRHVRIVIGYFRASFCLVMLRTQSEFYAITWTETTIDVLIVEKQAFEILGGLSCLRRRRFAAKNRSPILEGVRMFPGHLSIRPDPPCHS